jgi:hypothetical protein
MNNNQRNKQQAQQQQRQRQPEIEQGNDAMTGSACLP